MKSFLVFCCLNFVAGISGYIQKTMDMRFYDKMVREGMRDGKQNSVTIQSINDQNKFIYNGENIFRHYEKNGENRRADPKSTVSREREEKYVQKMIENFESKGLSRAEILKILQELLESTRHEQLKVIYRDYISKYKG